MFTTFQSIFSLIIKISGLDQGDFPNAETFYQNALTIPLFPSMAADEQDRVIQALYEVLA